MLCDNETCRKHGINCYNSSGRKLISNNDFCIQLRHIKCKVAHLARKQMQKVSNHTAYRLELGKIEDISGPIFRTQKDNTILEKNEMSATSGTTSYSDTDENLYSFTNDEKTIQSSSDGEKEKNPVDIENKTSDTKQPAVIIKNPRTSSDYLSIIPGIKYFHNWIKWIAKLITKQFKVLLVAIIIGILMWMALVYGAILGASLCNNGQLPSLQFGSSHSKITVF